MDTEPEQAPSKDDTSPKVTEGSEKTDQSHHKSTHASPSKESAPWQFKQEDNLSPPVNASQPAHSHAQTVSWSASEYVAHHKDPTWFMGLGFVIALLAIAIFLISHELFSPIMVAVLGVAFGVFAARQPQVLQYTINHDGLTIGQKFYSFDYFKSFSVLEEGALHSILLNPLRRFMPPISLYYEPAEEDKIIDVLADYLPFIEAKRDAVDSLMRRVRF